MEGGFSMADIVIVGNSGAARECHQLLIDCIWGSPTLRFAWNFLGFLSYKGFQAELGPLQPFFLGDLANFKIGPNHKFIIGIGMPQLREEVFLTLKERGASLVNLISPWSYVPGDFQLGEGNIINSTCNFSGASSVGDGNYFNGSVRLGHDVKIGSFNFFGPSTTMLGGSSMGNRNIMAVQSVLLEQGRIGNDNNIAPGSILFKGCRNNCRMAGNPALKIGEHIVGH